MATAQAWLDEYAESHQNKTNKLIHWFAVPSIYWSVAAMLWSVSVPAAFPGWLNWAVLGLLLTTAYYLSLSVKLGLAMAVFNALNWLALIGIERVNGGIPMWQIGLAVFIIAWIAQFYGHKVEGKKPSFFKDVFFLLIGPAWCVNHLIKKVGINL